MGINNLFLQKAHNVAKIKKPAFYSNVGFMEWL
jgi:hypothetical protein